MPPPAPADWLTQTKLHPPPLRGDAIPRARLLNALRNALTSHPLTLVSAPAGYGKTTLLAALAKDEGGTARPEPAEGMNDEIHRSSFIIHPSNIAWLSLDEEDNDPARFLAHLLAALRQTMPSLGGQAEARLASGGRPVDVAEALVVDLAHTLAEKLLLVLDDFQEVDASPDIREAMTTLVEAAPPGLRLCILSRSNPALPLARWRARGQLTTLTAADLQFTPEEIAELYSRLYGLPLNPAEVEHLARRTRGWAAGLVLLRNVLRGMTPEARAVYLDELTLTSDVYDFLAAEVLKRQSPAVRRFLLVTSLPDEITPPLADYLLGTSDAARQLRQLETRGLFLTCEDAHEKIYRYHPLFREFLSTILLEERGAKGVQALHRRAAKWYPGSGSTEQAIQHSLAAEDWTSAARDMESIAEFMLRAGRIHTLETWLGALPRKIRERPWLLVWQAKTQEMRGDLGKAIGLLARARTGFVRSGDKRGQAVADVGRAAMHFRCGEYVQCERWAHRALAELPKKAFALRAEALNRLGTSAIEQGRLKQAGQVFEQALALHRAAGDEAGQASVLHNLGAIAFHQGNFAEAIRLDEESLARFRALHTYQAVQPLITLAWTYQTRGDFSAALAAAEEAERMALSAGWRFGAVYARCFRADALVGLGREAEAPPLYAEARSVGEATGEPTLLVEPLLGESKFLRRTGQPAQALPPATLALRRARAAHYPYQETRALIELGLGHAHLGQGDQARRRWNAARRLSAKIGADFLACRACFYLADLDNHKGRPYLRECLELAEGRGWDFLFLRLECNRAMPLLAHALAEGSEYAAWLLMAIGIEALPAILPLSTHHSPAIRRMTLEVLGEIGGPEAAAVLRRTRRDADASVREAAVAALAKIARRPPAPLRVVCLGQFQIYRGDRLIDDRAWGRRAARRLFKILIAKRGHLVHREVLIEVLWPGAAAEVGANRLKALVHHLRRVLEPTLPTDQPSAFVLREGEQYGFDSQSPHTLDADEFRAEVARAERLLREGLVGEALSHFVNAEDLYRGDFLEEDLYEDWCAPERVELQEMRLRVLEALASGWLDRGDAERAAEFCRQALTADPLREAIHRLYLRALYRAGRRAEALRVHQAFRRQLRHELGVQPTPETEKVYEAVLRQAL